MAIKISELTAVTSIAGTEVLPLVQSTTTKKATISQLKGYRSFVALVTWDTLNEETVLTTLQNDDFTISLAKTGTGVFVLEDSSAPFDVNKTALFIMQSNNQGAGAEGIINVYFGRSNTTTLGIQVYDLNIVTGENTPSDTLNQVAIEIRVYP